MPKQNAASTLPSLTFRSALTRNFKRTVSTGRRGREQRRLSTLQDCGVLRSLYRIPRLLAYFAACYYRASTIAVSVRWFVA